MCEYLCVGIAEVMHGFCMADGVSLSVEGEGLVRARMRSAVARGARGLD